jgi:hypothetical protein
MSISNNQFFSFFVNSLEAEIKFFNSAMGVTADNPVLREELRQLDAAEVEAKELFQKKEMAEKNNSNSFNPELQEINLKIGFLQFKIFKNFQEDAKNDLRKCRFLGRIGGARSWRISMYNVPLAHQLVFFLMKIIKP